MYIEPRTREIRAHFKGSPGSEFIASEYTVQGLVDCLRHARPEVVVEVGAGIGTLTYAAIVTLDAIHGAGKYRLVTAEDNEFCRTQLVANLKDVADRYELVARVDAAVLSSTGPIDLLCIDGTQIALEQAQLAQRAVVYVEGDRRTQREDIEDRYKSRRLARANFRPLDRTKGFWLYQLEATPVEQVRLGARDLYERAGHAGKRVLLRAISERRLLSFYKRLRPRQ